MDIDKLIELIRDMDKTHDNSITIHTPIKQKYPDPGISYIQYEHIGECIVQIEFTPKK